MKHEVAPVGDVSRETRERLDLYAALLTRWNRKINLIGRQTENEMWQRHFVDSLQLRPLIPATAVRAIDLGSGAGFPGLVLAIATGLHFDLVESDRRKAAFLQAVASETMAPVTVHPLRIASLALAQADLLTARALAPLRDLLPLVHAFLKPDGVALLPKGARVDEELTDAAPGWQMRTERYPSVTDPHGVILRLTEVRRG